MQMTNPVERRSEQEMFYSCPATSAVAFFQAVSSCCQASQLELSPYASNAGKQLREVVEAIQATQVSHCIGTSHYCVSLLSLTVNLQTSGIRLYNALHALTCNLPCRPLDASNFVILC